MKVEQICGRNSKHQHPTMGAVVEYTSLKLAAMKALCSGDYECLIPSWTRVVRGSNSGCNKFPLIMKLHECCGRLPAGGAPVRKDTTLYNHFQTVRWCNDCTEELQECNARPKHQIGGRQSLPDGKRPHCTIGMNVPTDRVEQFMLTRCRKLDTGMPQEGKHFKEHGLLDITSQCYPEANSVRKDTLLADRTMGMPHLPLLCEYHLEHRNFPKMRVPAHGRQQKQSQCAHSRNFACAESVNINMWLQGM